MSRYDSPSRDEGRMPSRDISPVLKGWDYEPGTINVRKISGLDGSPKLQMRVDLGVLQMEMSGRPDGAHPTAANRSSIITKPNSTNIASGTERISDSILRPTNARPCAKKPSCTTSVISACSCWKISSP